MKKSTMLGVVGMALAMGQTANEFYSEDNHKGFTKKKIEPNEPKYIPFNKREGVLKTIEDYNLIVNGKSKKGLIKQARVKNRITEWLSSGMLKEEDLILNK